MPELILDELLEIAIAIDEAANHTGLKEQGISSSDEVPWTSKNWVAAVKSCWQEIFEKSRARTVGSPELKTAARAVATEIEGVTYNSVQRAAQSNGRGRKYDAVIDFDVVPIGCKPKQ